MTRRFALSLFGLMLALGLLLPHAVAAGGPGSIGHLVVAPTDLAARITFDTEGPTTITVKYALVDEPGRPGYVCPAARTGVPCPGLGGAATDFDPADFPVAHHDVLLAGLWPNRLYQAVIVTRTPDGKVNRLPISFRTQILRSALAGDVVLNPVDPDQ
jgi:hypothetical protein